MQTRLRAMRRGAMTEAITKGPPMKYAVLLAAAVMAAVSPTVAVARGNAADGLQAMRELNAIVLGDLDTRQHIQGKAFVGGNVKGRLVVAQGGSQSYRASNRPQLTVGGNSEGFIVERNLGEPITALVGGNAADMALNGNGTVQVGGVANIANFNPRAGKSVQYGTAAINAQAQDAAYLAFTPGLADPRTGLAATIAAQTTKLADDLGVLSLHLASLASISTITSTASALDYSRAADGYAVFTMTAAAFQDQNANFDTLFAGLPAGMTTIVNVLGDTLVQGGNINATALNQTVIWNFAQATSITTKGWHGSILAPLATLTNSSAIEGSVAVRAFTMNGEVHLGTFAGTSAIVASAVPEPATWAAMLVGFAMIAATLRGRRRGTALFSH